MAIIDIIDGEKKSSFVSPLQNIKLNGSEEGRRLTLQFFNRNEQSKAAEVDFDEKDTTALLDAVRK